MPEICNGMALMERANPSLFSSERYEEYPLEYEELKHYLTHNGIEDFPKRNSKPYTHIDYLDFLLYKTGDTASSIDLNKKLACEYALYQVQMQKKLSKFQDDSSVAMDKLLMVKSRSSEWYEILLNLLESINATNLDVHLLNAANPDTDSSLKGKFGGLKRTNTFIRTNSELQELTSFVLSNAIKRGVELKPINMDSPLEFLKNAIETLITSESSENDTGKGSKGSDTEGEELETAFKDLQLAHNFLTKQFENDRNEYLQNIEKLQKTNKELQQKLLDYHSDLSQAENKLQETEREVKELEETNKRVSHQRRKSFNISSPIFSGDVWNQASPVSAKSNGSTTANSNAHSITIMRTEFKRLLTESQRKYERELQEERESRLSLERELESLRKKTLQEESK